MSYNYRESRMDRAKEFVSDKVPHLPGRKVKFDLGRLQTMLRMSSQRLRLQMSKKINLNKQEKHKVAQLLDAGKEDLARIRVENIVRDDLMMESYEMLQVFSELVLTRIQLIGASRKCPPDLEEALYTLIWASLRVPMPELQQAMEMITVKFGKDFYMKGMRNDDGCVNERVMHKMGVAPPNQALVLSYMEEIARAHRIDWRPVYEDEEERVMDEPNFFPPGSGGNGDEKNSGFVPPGAQGNASSDDNAFVPPGAGGGIDIGVDDEDEGFTPPGDTFASSKLDDDDALTARLSALRGGGNIPSAPPSSSNASAEHDLPGLDDLTARFDRLRKGNQ